jgi:hypothetical protein
VTTAAARSCETQKMDNTYFDFLLALAAIAVPLGLAGLLVELRSRQESPPGKGRGHTAGAD